MRVGGVELIAIGGLWWNGSIGTLFFHASPRIHRLVRLTSIDRLFGQRCIAAVAGVLHIWSIETACVPCVGAYVDGLRAVNLGRLP